MKGSLRTCWCLLALTLNTSIPAQHSTKGMLSIVFDNTVNGVPLKEDTLCYKNDLGQSFSISKFNYYISNIELIRSNGSSYKDSHYYLLKDDEEETKKLMLKDIPEGEYTAIRFMVGVDSLHNCSGAQSGALDPVNGMFWAWNTGYIFLKLEGKSPASTAPGKIFEYHIGGYKPPANCIRSITLVAVKKIVIGKTGITALHVSADAAELLKTPLSIDFSKIPSVTGAANATAISDNYQDMFSIAP